MNNNVQMSYIGLPAEPCRECEGVEFARIGADLRCRHCSPTTDVDEWLIARQRGMRVRWAAGHPPHDTSAVSVDLFVSPTLQMAERPRGATDWQFLHSSLISRDLEPVWYRKIDLAYYAWLNRVVESRDGQVFDEDVAELKSAIGAIRDRAIGLGIFPPSVDDTNLWPSSVSAAEIFQAADALDVICDEGDRIECRKKILLQSS